ncbi:hypothetical protein PAMA_019833 [Pampus argenteus]
MATETDLLQILEHLDEKELIKFIWYLQSEVVIDEPIPRSSLDGADRAKIVRLMFQRYTDEAASNAAKILSEMSRKDLVEQLEQLEDFDEALCRTNWTLL